MKINLWASLLALSILASCKTTEQETNPETFQFLEPIVADTSYINEYVAEIQSINYVEIRSRLRGFIEQIHVDEGQLVEKGQLLFSINSLEFEKEYQKANAAYKSALADLKSAEVELINTRNLAEKNIVSKAELEMAKAKVEALEANVESAKANEEQAHLSLSFSKIKAPFKGIINRIPNKAGSLIEEGGMLTSISDNSQVFAYFNLSETEYLNYLASDDKEESKVVKLKLANNKVYEQDGNIEIIESEFDGSTGNIAFRARFPNPQYLLRHGANGKIQVTKSLKEAILIPQRSAFEIQDKMYVFVLKNDSTVEQRNIVRKLRIPHFFILESGLKKGERILFEGVQKVKQGDKIIPQIISGEKVIELTSRD
jgi:RND family efflux transporter MFP subunit